MAQQRGFVRRRTGRRRRAAGWILAGVAAWTALISVAHVGANLGFSEVVEEARVRLGYARRSLRVGFLPVT